MLIPRENKLVRFYVQLRKAEASVDGPLNKSAYSANQILKAAQVILSPYELSYDYCDWWSAYQVGQRVAENFSVHNRVFLAGDAVRKSYPGLYIDLLALLLQNVSIRYSMYLC